MTRFGPWEDGGVFTHAPMAFVNNNNGVSETGFWGASPNTGLIGGPTDISGALAFWGPSEYASVYGTAADQSSWVAGANVPMFYANFDMRRDPFPAWSWEYLVAMGTQARAFVAYVPWYLDPTWTGLPPGAIGVEVEGGATYCTVLGLEVGTARSWIVTDSTPDAATSPVLANVTGTARLRALTNEPTGVFTPDVLLGPHYDIDWGGPATFDVADAIVDELDLSTISTPTGSDDTGGTLNLTSHLYGPAEAGLFFGYTSLEEFSPPDPTMTPPDDGSEINVLIHWFLEDPLYTVRAPRRRFIYSGAPLPRGRVWPVDEGRVWPPNRRNRRGGRAGSYS